MNGAAPTRPIAVIAVAFSLAVMTAPASAAAEASGAALTGRDAQIDSNPNETNPCTGAVGDLIDDERDSWTVVTRTDGSTLLRGHSVSRVSFLPYDPAAASYTGEETYTDVETTSPGADAFLIAHRLRLHGTDGGALAISEQLRVVITPDGSTRVATTSSSLSCDQHG